MIVNEQVVEIFGLISQELFCIILTPGNVDAIEGDIVVITSEGDRKEYNLPKSQVGGYDGAEVSLKITFGELDKYKV